MFECYDNVNPRKVVFSDRFQGGVFVVFSLGF